MMSQPAGAYDKEMKDGVLIFTLRADLSPKSANNFASDVQASVVETPETKKIVINAGDRYMFDAISLRVVGNLASELKKQGYTVFILGPADSLRKYIQSMGMASLLKLVTSIDEVNGKEASPFKKINVEFVNPFIEGTIKTLKVQCAVDCVPHKPALKATFTESMKFDIAGVINLTEPFRGMISICFPKEVFLGAMSGMLGESCPEITKDLEDGAGELMNIIFGHAKTVLNEKGYALPKALPTIVREPNKGQGVMSMVLVLPFQTPFGNFYIEIGIR